jgi:hypothetical protein
MANVSVFIIAYHRLSTRYNFSFSIEKIFTTIPLNTEFPETKPPVAPHKGQAR